MDVKITTMMELLYVNVSYNHFLTLATLLVGSVVVLYLSFMHDYYSLSYPLLDYLRCINYVSDFILYRVSTIITKRFLSIS